MEIKKSADSITSALKKGALEWSLALAHAFLESSASKEGSISTGDFLMIESLYFLALKVMQRGGNANSILQALGIRWSLSAELLSLPRHPQQSGSAMDNLSPVRLIANAIPQEMLLRLQEGFARHAYFWRQHNYGSGTPFHSYLLTDLDKRAATLLGQTAQVVLEHIRAEYPDKAGEITAAEFWAHLRSADSPHQLHVDTDESLLQAERPQQHLPHPIFSAVLFLECCSCAGPTVVLSHGKPSRQGDEAWAAYPDEGAVLLYPGLLFHGVLPGRWHTCGKYKDRTTLIFAFWGGQKQSYTRSDLGPCMPYNEDSDLICGNKDLSSVLETPAVACKSVCGSRQYLQKATAWQRVPKPIDSSFKYISAPLPDLRFFLRRKCSLQQLYT